MINPGSLRFILAFVVILFHITKLVFIGHFAVFCFFILSGYWVTLMYSNKYSSFLKPLQTFYVSRIWRLFPVFILFNILAFAIYPFYRSELSQVLSIMDGGSKVHFWLSNFFLLGLNYVSPQILVPAWSLDIEFQFYLLFPLLLLLLKKNIYFLLIASLVLSLVLMTLLKDAFIVKTLLYYLFYFLIGMWIFLKQIRFSEKMENYFNVVFILILTAHYIVPQLRQLTIGDLASSYNGYLNELLPLLMIPLISNAVLRKSSSLDRTLGDMSYVMYLCHWLLIMPYTYYSKGTSFIQRIPYSLAYVLVTLLVSYLIYKYYDRPIDSLRRKWINSMK